MIEAVALGAGAGSGLLLVTRGILPRPEPVQLALVRLAAPGRSVADEAAGPGRARIARMVSLAGHGTSDRLARDLAVAERTAERHAVDRLVAGAGATFAGLLVAGAMSVTGTRLPAIAVVAFGLSAGGVGFTIPDLLLRSYAARRRDAMRHALSAFLDLVNVLLAGGAGVETALSAAADAGDGWAFRQMRAALTRARSTRSSPWDAFAALGAAIGVVELVELAASVRLAGEQGARIKSSLSAKAAAMRTHQIARLEAEAQSATERMGLPTVLMFLGFMVLLGYPAVQLIAGAL